MVPPDGGMFFSDEKVWIRAGVPLPVIPPLTFTSPDLGITPHRHRAFQVRGGGEKQPPPLEPLEGNGH